MSFKHAARRNTKGWLLSLSVKKPAISAEWHPTLNANLPWTPDNTHFKAEIPVFWKCSIRNSHVWRASIRLRTRDKLPQKCPFCENKAVSSSNSLQARNPEVAYFWHDSLNGKVRPKDVVYNSGATVWWEIDKSKGPFKEQIKNMTEEI